MNRELIAQKIKDILEMPNITESDRISKIVQDSLEVLELIMVIEDVFDVNIPIDHTIVTFEELLNTVEKALNGTKASII